VPCFDYFKHGPEQSTAAAAAAAAVIQQQQPDSSLRRSVALYRICMLRSGCQPHDTRSLRGCSDIHTQKYATVRTNSTTYWQTIYCSHRFSSPAFYSLYSFRCYSFLQNDGQNLVQLLSIFRRLAFQRCQSSLDE
jgi:hypothetical protein